ncbi:hypothetical protein WN55_04356 [Dufourea novaeangliae]|uniref:Uncharacterized protein n=1 Tax=Dufourea novaeangliae TaxID=178035 RepID=A0A154PLV6_DUFNO|nr:hypothetical protein WN55_04356 [Dufourea novaeangliae]
MSPLAYAKASFDTGNDVYEATKTRDAIRRGLGSFCGGIARVSIKAPGNSKHSSVRVSFRLELVLSESGYSLREKWHSTSSRKVKPDPRLKALLCIGVSQLFIPSVFKFDYNLNV